MHRFRLMVGEYIKKTNGVKYNANQKINRENYIECLNGFKDKSLTQCTINFYCNEFFSSEQTKMALS